MRRQKRHEHGECNSTQPLVLWQVHFDRSSEVRQALFFCWHDTKTNLSTTRRLSERNLVLKWVCTVGFPTALLSVDGQVAVFPPPTILTFNIHQRTPLIREMWDKIWLEVLHLRLLPERIPLLARAKKSVLPTTKLTYNYVHYLHIDIYIKKNLSFIVHASFPPPSKQRLTRR
jgi:hypothetical protein